MSKNDRTISKFFECKFERDYFDLQYLPYKNYSSKEAYNNLKAQNPDYEFYRFDVTLDSGKADQRIYFWSKTLNSSTKLTGQKDNIVIQNNPKITSKIIESSILQHLKAVKGKGGFEVYKKREEHFWSIVSPKELVPEIKDLIVRNKFHFNTFFFSHNNELTFGFLISRDINYKFTIGRNEFIKRGIECRDLKGRDDNIFANKQSLKRFLTATGQQGIHDIKIKELEHNKAAFTKIKEVFDWLDKEKNKIFLPSENHFSEFSIKYLPLENDKIQADKLKEPTRYYFENRTGKGLYNEVISQLKPYSYKAFQHDIIKIIIICPKFNEGVLEGFTTHLENLLKGIFHINIEFSNIFLEDTKADDYEDSIYQDKINSANLVIVVLNEFHLQITDIKKSPYYICKAKLIGQGIPTQDVQVKHIQKLNPYIMKNLALNIYAKIGGTGWTIENIEKRKEELVVGIGSSMNKEGKLVLGIAQIFRSDGRYLVGDCSPLSTFENYAENLEKHLYNSLSKVIDTTINKLTEFRLIFHLFKSASYRYEIQAVENVIRKFKTNELTFKYAFVHLAYGHNFRLFTNDGINNKTIKVYGKEQGINATQKGTYIELTKLRSLVHFVEESTIPLEIEIDKRSTFQDLRYISTQVYWFSHLSHRTFLPSKKTVTILYPSLMAGLMEKLREVEDWDKKRPEKITEKLWFI